MRNYRSPWGAVCLLAILSLAVYGCGGGGSSGPAPMAPEEPMEPMEPGDGDGMAGGGDTPTDCPEGQSPNDAGDCVADAPPGPTPEQMAAEAERVAKAISDPSKNVGFVGDGATDAGLEQANIAVDAGKVNQFTNPPNPDATPPVPNQFTASDEQATIRGWAGSTNTRTRENGAVTDVVVNYTDIKPKADEDYQEYYADGVTRPGVTSTGGPGQGLTQRTATLADDISMIADQIVAARFPDQPHQTFTFTDDANTAATDESMVRGTLHGIPGIFNCPTTCTVVTDDEGSLSATTGGWIFIPAEPAQGSKHIVRGVTADTDYMDFGYWMESTTEDGETSYQVRPYVRGADIADTSAVRGTATYAGPATGIYMKKSVADDGSVSPLVSGQFRANASLTANFTQTTAADEVGADSIAPALLNSITGTITNFRDNEGNAIAASWNVELGRAAITGGTGLIGSDTTTHDAGTTGGGSWQGQFYGPTLDAGGTTPIQPAGVGGTFDAHFSNGHVAGAFGATKQD